LGWDLYKRRFKSEAEGVVEKFNDRFIAPEPLSLEPYKIHKKAKKLREMKLPMYREQMGPWKTGEGRNPQTYPPPSKFCSGIFPI
jgi:hypothetical protein